MKVETLLVTPKMAREWLKKNTDNRPLRRSHVDALRAAYDRGEWRLIHAGLAFSDGGRLLDGQHRLTMIAGLPDGEVVPMSVAHGMDAGAFTVIDQGKIRTASDVFGVTPTLSAAARFFARITDPARGSAVTMDLLRPYIEWVEPEHATLEAFCSTCVRIWSSAPVRSAAIFQMKRGHDEDYIKRAYHALVHSDVEAAPYAARALMQQRLNGTIASARSVDLFCRSLRVFDSTQRGRVQKILVRDMEGTLQEVRDFVRAEMKKSPVNAGATVAKPAVHSSSARLTRAV